MLGPKEGPLDGVRPFVLRQQRPAVPKGQVVQGNSLETIRNMVASNLGITVLPCSAATERYVNPLVKVIPFSAPVPVRRIALAWRKSYAREMAVNAICDAIKEIKSPCLHLIN